MVSKYKRFAVSLLDERVLSPEQALKNPASLERFELVPIVPYSGAIFVRPRSNKTPAWVPFLEEGTATPLGERRSLSPGAVLFVSTSERLFAVSFGLGRNLLRSDAVVRGFGLRVVLNAVDPRRVRCMDISRFEDLVMATRHQASRGSSLTTFGLDVTRDILKAVTGEPRNLNLATRLSGADTLILTAEVPIAAMADKCSQLLERYSSDDYRQQFGWIDQLTYVRDAALKARLDELLIGALAGDEHFPERAYLAPPEVLDWSLVSGFRFSTMKDEQTQRDDLGLEDYLSTLRDPGSITVKKLKRDKVAAMSSDTEEPLRLWSVYSCIVFEVQHEDKLFVLTDGQWFEVSLDFSSRVTQFVRDLPAELSMPPAQSGDTEDEYNGRAAAALANCSLLHGMNVRWSDTGTAIEVCDLLAERQFIHVKRRTRSSTLSHLFSQGTISAEAFLSDPSFRAEVRAKGAQRGLALEHVFPESRPDPGLYSVVYAIISKSPAAWPECLPFFSRLNLMQAARRLAAMGFGVRVADIREAG